MNVLKLGKVSLDGTKIKANASKRRALSWKHACKHEKQLKEKHESPQSSDRGGGFLTLQGLWDSVAFAHFDSFIRNRATYGTHWYLTV